MTKEQILAEIKKVNANKFLPEAVKAIKIKKLNAELATATGAPAGKIHVVKPGVSTDKSGYEKERARQIKSGEIDEKTKGISLGAIANNIKKEQAAKNAPKGKFKVGDTVYPINYAEAIPHEVIEVKANGSVFAKDKTGEMTKPVPFEQNEISHIFRGKAKKYAEDTLLAGDTMHTAYAKYELKPKT